MKMDMDAWHQIVDFAVYREIETHDPMKVTRQSNDLYLASPATFSGTLAKVKLLFDSGDFLEGYHLYKNTLEHLAMVNGRKSYSALKRRYVKESGSATMSPSIDSILNHIRSW